jgi:hypothetical protein
MAELKPGRKPARQYWRVAAAVLLLAPNLVSMEKLDTPKETRAAVSEPELKTGGPLVLPRIGGPVALDGMSREKAWEGLTPLPFTQMEPHAGAEPSERSEILLAYDDHYLYLAGRLYDREPQKVLSNSKQRDSGNPSCEWFGIVIDSYNDKENALAFFTTPAGLRWDAAVFNDAQGEEPINTSWNTFWDVAAVRNDEGWFAEFRIPFSSLRFQDRDGRVTIGVIVWRQIARKNEWDIFPAIPAEWGFWSKFKPSRAQEFALEGLTGRRPVYATPYLLGGLGRTAELDAARTAYLDRKVVERQAGLDLKYGLSSNLTFDITVNPDFAQVEADDQQINLTRFSLFFPEKRLFFQERSSIFDFTFETSEENRLFYSRRIGLQDGEKVGIYGGLRLVGRVGAWDLGFMDMHTSTSASGRPGENIGVLRLRRQVLNPYSYVGSMVTSRIGQDGSYNVAYGLDSVIRVFGEDYLTVKWAQSFADGKTNNPFAAEPSRYYLNWQRRSLRGLGYGLSLSGSGADYEPGVGFQLRDNYTRWVGSVWHGWFPGEGSWLFDHILKFDTFLFIRNGDDLVETLILAPSWRFDSKPGFAFSFTPSAYYENIPAAFPLSERVEVPQGTYRFFNLKAEFETPSRRPLNAKLAFDAGSFYDGRRLSISVAPRWSALADLELGAFYEFDVLRFPARGQRLDSHIVRIRALYMLSTKFSAGAFIQYSSEAKAVIGNIRFRYNPREGVDLYLVYDETLNAGRGGLIPVPPFSSGRTVMVKYSYTFSL